MKEKLDYFIDLGNMKIFFSQDNLERFYEERYEDTQFDWKDQLSKAHIARVTSVEEFNWNPLNDLMPKGSK